MCFEGGGESLGKVHRTKYIYRNRSVPYGAKSRTFNMTIPNCTNIRTGNLHSRIPHPQKTSILNIFEVRSIFNFESIKIHQGGQAKFITTACKAIANKLQSKAGRRRAQQPTRGDQKHSWAKTMLANPQPAQFPETPPPWAENPIATHFIEAKVAATAPHRMPIFNR